MDGTPHYQHEHSYEYIFVLAAKGRIVFNPFFCRAAASNVNNLTIIPLCSQTVDSFDNCVQLERSQQYRYTTIQLIEYVLDRVMVLACDGWGRGSHGLKDEVRQARRAANKKSGPGGAPRLLVLRYLHCKARSHRYLNPVSLHPTLLSPLQMFQLCLVPTADEVGS